MISRLRNFGWAGIILTIAFIASNFLYFTNSWTKSLRTFFAPPDRIILSTVTGKVVTDTISKIVKIQTPQGLVIELYGELKDGLTPLLAKVEIPNSHDAYIQFLGRATNLALKDLDSDQLFEIIAPSYDSGLTPHLNIFKYNPDAKALVPYIAPAE